SGSGPIGSQSVAIREANASLSPIFNSFNTTGDVFVQVTGISALNGSGANVTFASVPNTNNVSELDTIVINGSASVTLNANQGSVINGSPQFSLITSPSVSLTATASVGTSAAPIKITNGSGTVDLTVFANSA